MAEEKLNIQYLVNLLAEKHDLDKQSTETFIREFFLLVEEALEKDKIVKIKNFGTFKITEVKSRESINVNTGERFEIQGHSKVSFIPDPSVREIINKPFSHFETIVLKDSVNFDKDSIENEVLSVEDENYLEDNDDENIPETLSNGQEQENDDIIIPKDSEVKEIDEENGSQSEDLISELSTESEKVMLEETNESIEEDIHEENIAETERVSSDESHEEEEPEIKLPLNEIIARELQETNRLFNKSIDGDLSANEMVGGTSSKPSKTFIVTTVIVAILVCGTAVLYTYFPGFMDNLFLAKTNNTETVQNDPPVIEDVTTEIPIVIDTISSNEEPEKNEEIIEKVDEKVEEAVKPVTETIKKEEPTTKPVQVTTVKENTVKSTSKEISSSGINDVKSKPVSYDDTPVRPDSTSYKIIGTKTDYTIKSGETLTRVALRFYGTKDLWPYLVMHNRDKIPNPQVVPAGLTIMIPELEKK